MEKAVVNLKLDVHTVRMEVPVEYEPVYREAAKQLNEEYAKMRRSYSKSSAEQVWAYTALLFAVNLNNDARSKALGPIEGKIKELTQLIQTQL